MEERIETRVSAEKIWQTWEMAHAKQGEEALVQGKKGKSSRGSFRYEVLDVVKGESFTLVWKTVFLRLIFSHAVFPKKRGAEIVYSVQIRGFFGAPARWFLGNKIRQTVRGVLKTMVKRLEMEC